jgi:hypothetical protein
MLGAASCGTESSTEPDELQALLHDEPLTQISVGALTDVPGPDGGVSTGSGGTTGADGGMVSGSGGTVGTGGTVGPGGTVGTGGTVVSDGGIPTGKAGTGGSGRWSPAAAAARAWAA